MRTTFQLTATIMATCVVGVTGCGGRGAAGGKSAGPAAPVTIRLGTVEGKTAPYADEVEHFAQTVETLSDGSLHVDIVWEAPGPYHAESETDLANMVTTGGIGLAIVPTRAWDQLDVTSLEALQTPFLIDSVSLVNRIVGSELAGDMMAGLDALGVDGLALWPDSLRHPISFGAPLVTIDDFRGLKLRVPRSDFSNRIAHAIGVDPVDPPDWDAAIEAGQMAGAESAFAWADQLPKLGTFTANITFYPKINTVAANKQALSKMTADQQDVLRRAAIETLTYVESTNSREYEMAAGYCAQGGGVALTDDATRSTLTDLVQPLTAELEQRADTKRVIGVIRTMKKATTPDPAPVACARPTTEVPVTTDAVAAASFPEGIYRTEAPGGEVVTMSYTGGTWKRFFEDGRLDCQATYVVHDGRIWMSMSTDRALACGNVPGAPFLDAAWTLDGDQLRLSDIISDPGAVREFSLPWTKIG